MRAVTRTRSIVETHYEEIPEEEQLRLQAFQQAVSELRAKHESPEEREQARSVLRGLVVEQMERDLTNREEQLAEIESQAKQLRDQLEQRKAAKDEFLKLIMMMVEHPSSGIGLPSEWMSSIGPGAYGASGVSKFNVSLPAGARLPPAGPTPLPSAGLVPQPVAPEASFLPQSEPVRY